MLRWNSEQVRSSAGVDMWFFNRNPHIFKAETESSLIFLLKKLRQKFMCHHEQMGICESGLQVSCTTARKRQVWFVCGWQVKLCESVIPSLSRAKSEHFWDEVHYKALYKSTLLYFYFIFTGQCLTTMVIAFWSRWLVTTTNQSAVDRIQACQRSQIQQKSESILMDIKCRNIFIIISISELAVNGQCHFDLHSMANKQQRLTGVSAHHNCQSNFTYCSLQYTATLL